MSQSRRRRGSGTIKKRPDGYCAAIATADLGLTVAQKYLYYYHPQRAACVAWLSQKIREAQTGTLRAPNRRSIATFFEAWLASRTDLRTTTLGLYRSVIKTHIVPYIGSRQIGDFRPNDVRRYYAELDANGVTMRNRAHVHNLLFAAFKLAVRDGELTSNPIASVVRPRYVADRRVPLLEEQVEALLDAIAGDRYEAMYALALGTGLRVGELFGLQWDDVDFAERRIFVRRTVVWHKEKWLAHEPKTAAGRRTIDIDDELVAVLKRHRQLAFEAGHRAEPWVFCAPEGGPLNKRNFARREWGTMRTKAKLPDTVHFHDLRHTAMALLIARGAHIKVVQERAGHTNAAFTMNVYGHALPGLGRAAADSVGPLFRKLNGTTG